MGDTSSDHDKFFNQIRKMHPITKNEFPRTKYPPQNGTSANGKQPPPEPWAFPLAVSRHWAWIALAAVIAGILGFQFWSGYWKGGYEATAQLIRTESSDHYLELVPEVDGTTLSAIIDSSEVHRRVGSRMRPLLLPRQVGRIVKIEPSRNNEIIEISGSFPDEQMAIQFANTYAEETISVTGKMQAAEASGAYQNLERQLALVQEDLASVQAELSSKPNLLFTEQMASAPTRSLALFENLEEAGDELLLLMGRYTQAHPLVQEQQARVAMLEQQMADLNLGAGEREGDAGRSTGSGKEYGDGLIAGLLELEAQRVLIRGQMRMTQVVAESPPGLYRIFAPASEQTVEAQSPLPIVAAATLASSMFGFFLATGLFMTVELFDRRMKSPSDILRVTQLPILAVLGRKPSKRGTGREKWAFRTWTSLQNSLSATPGGGLVCGFTSSRPKEGRTLWVTALADAANQCGFRVLRITAEDAEERKRREAAHEAKTNKSNGMNKTNGSENTNEPKKNSEETSVAPNWMQSPGEITRRVADPSHPPVVHIPLPGWVWNRDRRQEWFAALEEWRRIEDLVILIELPPASSPETVLLSQDLPNLVWLVDSRKARAPETQDQLQTLREAGGNLVGTVVNRAPATFQNSRFARWRPAAAAVCLLSLLLDPSPGLQAQAVADQAADTSARSSMESTDERAEWQRELTLGTGDILQISLIGAPELTRDPIAIQSDGTINFLEVNGLHAAGLSVDELRSKIDEALSEYRRSPRTMVVPIEYNSKKYYMLGRVGESGTYTLDRSLTVVEAVARAEGFQTGLTGQGPNQGELVDLSRSFLIRNGERHDLDFKKLFAAGDLANNIHVEPNDYFYFPPVRHQEVYLLGAFEEQGPVELTEGLSVVRAVAARGGMTRDAWRENILLVRGSFADPETHRISIADVLAGREADVPLMAGDIIYISERPWIRAERLLDNVVSAFAQTVTVHWTSNNIISR